jgi:hypothetical protein
MVIYIYFILSLKAPKLKPLKKVEEQREPVTVKQSDQQKPQEEVKTDANKEKQTKSETGR